MSDRKTAQQLKERVREQLHVLGEAPSKEPFALSAQWPDAVLALAPSVRKERVRQGRETVLLKDDDAEGGIRGFVRAVLRVPLGHEEAQVYGVFVEVDREAYVALQDGFRQKRETYAEGILATKIPLLGDAFESRVTVFEDGGEKRARIVKAESDILREGPAIGP